ncbi:MAG: hypothetical protein AB7S26_41165 [Sandaracinaceae bacterium]
MDVHEYVHVHEDGHGRWGAQVIRREILGRASTSEGGEVKLIKDGGGYTIMSDDRILMTSRTHGSEEAMARLACHRVKDLDAPRILVGGLGLGYTLRATLDRVNERAEVVCAELMDAIVDWHRGPLGPLADHPIDDPRVRMHVGDVSDAIREPGGGYDAIVLDVDNGPIPMTVVSNWWLYAKEGLAALYAATRPGGIAIVWSAGEDELFLGRMRAAGFDAEVMKVAARTGRRKRRGRGSSHVLFIGRRAEHRDPVGRT